MDRIERYYYLYKHNMFNPKNWDWHIRWDEINKKFFIYVIDETKHFITRFACTSYSSAIRVCRLFNVHLAIL